MKILADKLTKEILGYAVVGTVSAVEDDHVVFNSQVKPDPLRNYKLSGSDGNWSVVEKTEVEQTSQADERLGDRHRSVRNTMLTQTDYVTIRALEAGEVLPQTWVSYRQSLRDLTSHSNWPNLSESDWPIKPE